MTNETFTPSVDLTIFPRINYLKAFGPRAVRRDLNGRIFGEYGHLSIDSERYPPADGSTCLRVTFPHDLGPAVTTHTTTLYDLREDCGSPDLIDLQLTGPEVNTSVIGEVTISVNDIIPIGALTLLVNDPVPAKAIISGDAQNTTYLWEGRNNYPLMVGQQAANTVLTFPTAGPVTVTCTISDGDADDSPQTGVVDFFIVDALD